MTRNMLGALALAAALGSTQRHPETEAKLREEREAQERLNASFREARIAHQREEIRREIERNEKYFAGIDPTNGRPLSRQQRRRIARKGLPHK